MAISVGPFPGERLAYRLARRMALLTDVDPSHLRTLFLVERFTIDSIFPEPARSLLRSSEEENVRGIVTHRGPESEGAPPVSGPSASSLAISLDAGRPAKSGGSAVARLASLFARVLPNPVRAFRDFREAIDSIFLDEGIVDRGEVTRQAVGSLLRLVGGLVLIHAAVLVVVRVALGFSGK